jgi:hypothetical protein
VYFVAKTLKEMDRAELINLERLAHILKGLSIREFETLEILLDENSTNAINRSIKELNAGERIPIDERKKEGQILNLAEKDERPIPLKVDS